MILSAFFTSAGKHSDIDTMERPPVPRIMQPVLGPVHHSRARRVSFDDFLYDERISLRPVMVPMNLVDRKRDFPVSSSEPVITLETLPLEFLHRRKTSTCLVGAVDQISGIDQAENLWTHFSPTVLSRDWSSGELAQDMDRSTVGSFRVWIKTRGRMRFLGEVLRVSRHEKAISFACDCADCEQRCEGDGEDWCVHFFGRDSMVAVPVVRGLSKRKRRMQGFRGLPLRHDGGETYPTILERYLATL